MIPKVAGRGHSFKGLTEYLLNNTDEMEPDDESRVAWSETVNLLTDDIEKAAKVMAWTDLHAEDLKRGAGVSTAGAKPSAGAVYHYALSWAHDEAPDQEHMRAQVIETISRLGLSEHEFYMVAHKDRPHRHVHVCVNLTHPETGRRAELGRDFVILQRWALEYEEEHGLHCEVRKENAVAREAGAKVKHQNQRKDYSTKITRAFYLSDDGKSFAAALEIEGLQLARSRRGNGYVVVDEEGDIQRLSRQLEISEKGKAKTEAIAKKLEGLDRASVPDGDELSAEIKARAELAYREEQEARQQNAMLDAADRSGAEDHSSVFEDDGRNQAADRAKRIQRAEAAFARKTLIIEQRQVSEALRLEDELQDRYGLQLQDVSQAADHLQGIVDGKGVRLALRRVWRGKRDREELAELRQDIQDIKTTIAEQREKLTQIHHHEKMELAALHLERLEALGRGYRKSRNEAQGDRSFDPYEHRVNRRYVGRQGRPMALETANKLRDRRIQQRAWELREALRLRAERAATEARMEAQRPAFEARQTEIRRQRKIDDIQQEIDRLDSGQRLAKDKGIDFEP